MSENREIRLGDLLIEAGLLNRVQIDTALQAQQIFGGRLGTNLLELGYLDDQTLTDFLSRQLGIPRASSAELETIAPAVLARIPAKAAVRLGVLPLREENGALFLAMLDPGDQRVRERIEKNLQLRIEPRVIAEVELVYYLEKYYQVPRDIRHIKIMDQLLARRREAKAAEKAPPLDMEQWLTTIISAEETVALLRPVSGLLQRVPVRKTQWDLKREQLPHQAGFILYQLDGMLNVEDLLVISPYNRITTARILSEFIRRGYVELQQP